VADWNAALIKVVDWLNANEGVVSVLIFPVTLFLAWVSGIFAALQRRPKLRIRLIDGPTFCSPFQTGKKYGTYDVHRTAFALYLSVANVGWHIKPFSLLWLRRRVTERSFSKYVSGCVPATILR
jgi:hypothetical protein